jgi:hypothetical protein
MLICGFRRVVKLIASVFPDVMLKRQARVLQALSHFLAGLAQALELLRSPAVQGECHDDFGILPCSDRKHFAHFSPARTGRNWR